ncbi:RICIN domain-containing protein [Bacillus mycoides]|uniref:RICIN domain-containing protein n=1 Tax=Bacillus mycoides TaxID=1405 RepID=UPI003D65FE99
MTKLERNNIIQSVVITSDPQYPWTPRMDNNDNGESEDETKRISENLIREQYDSINSYITGNGACPVLINGDITAFGHSWQRKKMKELLNQLIVRTFYGLGNHDIENNFNDCWNNSCTEGSLLDYVYHVQDIPSKFLDEMDIEFDSGMGLGSYKGSFAYSIIDKDVYSIQLNNYPTMEMYLFPNKTEYKMYSTLDWLEKVLQKASALGKIIIVNVHKPNDWKGGPSERFKKLLKEYDVKAIFCGHYHKSLGYKSVYKDYFGDVPVFLSGGASQRTYLILEMTKEELLIYSVKENNWKEKKLEKRIEIQRDEGIYKIESSVGIGSKKVLTQLEWQSGITLDNSHNDDVRQNWYFKYIIKKDAYQIVNLANSSLVMTLHDNELDVLTQPNVNTDAQYWYLKAIGDGYYIIQSKKNPKLVLDAIPNRSIVVLEEHHPPTKSQKFKLKTVAVYEIETALSDTKVLEVSNFDKKVIISDRNNSDNQKWFLAEYVPGIRNWLINVGNPNLKLTWNADSDLREVYVASGYNNNNEWRLDNMGDGYCVIEAFSFQNKLVLDVDGANPNNGTKIKVNERHPVNNENLKAQKFKLIEITKNIIDMESLRHKIDS